MKRYTFKLVIVVLFLLKYTSYAEEREYLLMSDYSRFYRYTLYDIDKKRFINLKSTKYLKDFKGNNIPPVLKSRIIKITENGKYIYTLYRNIPKKIESNRFTNKIYNKLSEEDKKFISNYYLLDNNKKDYFLKENIDLEIIKKISDKLHSIWYFDHFFLQVYSIPTMRLINELEISEKFNGLSDIMMINNCFYFMKYHSIIRISIDDDFKSYKLEEIYKTVNTIDNFHIFENKEILVINEEYNHLTIPLKVEYNKFTEEILKDLKNESYNNYILTHYIPDEEKKYYTLIDNVDSEIISELSEIIGTTNFKNVPPDYYYYIWKYNLISKEKELINNGKDINFFPGFNSIIYIPESRKKEGLIYYDLLNNSRTKYNVDIGRSLKFKCFLTSKGKLIYPEELVYASDVAIGLLFPILSLKGSPRATIYEMDLKTQEKKKLFITENCGWLYDAQYIKADLDEFLKVDKKIFYDYKYLNDHNR